MRPCPHCRGVGKIEYRDGDVEMCPECDGSGIVNGDEEPPATIREPEAED